MKRLFIVLGILTIVMFIPVKWTLCGLLEFVAVNENGIPQEGVIFYQEWGRTDFGDPDLPSVLNDTVITGKDGKAIFPARYYYFFLWRIIEVETVGFIKNFVNYDNGSYSFFKINGINVKVDADYQNGAKIKVLIGTCSEDVNYFCYYQCNIEMCELINRRQLTKEELYKKYGITPKKIEQ